MSKRPAFHETYAQAQTRIREYATQLLLFPDGNLRPDTFLIDQSGQYIRTATWPHLNALLGKQFIVASNDEMLMEFCAPSSSDSDGVYEEKRRFMRKTIKTAEAEGICPHDVAQNLLEHVPAKRIFLPVQAPPSIDTKSAAIIPPTPKEPVHAAYTPGQFVSRLLLGQPLTVADLKSTNRSTKRFRMRVLRQASKMIDDVRKYVEKPPLNYTTKQMLGFFESDDPIPEKLQNYLAALPIILMLPTSKIPELPEGFWAKDGYTEKDVDLVAPIMNAYHHRIQRLLHRDTRLRYQHEPTAPRGRP